MATSSGDAYLAENHQPRLYGAFISTYLLAVIAVCLRLSARKRFSKAGLWLDDYAICAALGVATGYFIDMIIWVQWGYGRHIDLYGSERIERVKHVYVGLFVCEILFPFILCLTKFSILFFYMRIFGKTKIRIAFVVLGSIVTGWAIAVVITTIFQCNPIQGFWDRSLNPHCAVNVQLFFIGNAAPNVITDWALLLLPLPLVWGLHQERSQKIALCGVFGLGGFTCIVAIVRLRIMATQLSHRSSTDVTWVFNGSSIWTAVEVNIGIVSACLPSLRPILIAILNHPALASKGSSSNHTKVWVGHSRNRSHGVWPKCHQEPYIRASRGSKYGDSDEIRNIWNSEPKRGSRDVLVRHGLSIVEEKRESDDRVWPRGL